METSGSSLYGMASSATTPRLPLGALMATTRLGWTVPPFSTTQSLSVAPAVSMKRGLWKAEQ